MSPRARSRSALKPCPVVAGHVQDGDTNEKQVAVGDISQADDIVVVGRDVGKADGESSVLLISQVFEEGELGNGLATDNAPKDFFGLQR